MTERDEVRGILLEGDPSQWLSLAREGRFDAVAELLLEQPAPERDDPLTRAAAFVLAAGFIYPRTASAEALALDLARAQAVLVGGPLGDREWPALSSGVVSSAEAGEPSYPYPSGPLATAIVGDLQPFIDATRRGLTQPSGEPPGLWRLGHVTLAEPLVHPASAATIANARGWTPAAAQAVLDGEAYVEVDGSARLFPWYAEEDEETRPPAQARADRLGLALAPRFLDEPFESAWYVARTGPDAVGEATRVDLVPLFPMSLRPLALGPGGALSVGRITQDYELLLAALAPLEWAPPSARGLLRSEAAAVLRLLLAHLAPQRYRPPVLGGASADLLEAPPTEDAALKVRQLTWAGPHKLALACPGRLLLVGLDGEAETRELAGLVEHATDTLLVCQTEQGRHVLELATGSWLVDRSLAGLEGEGALPCPFDPPPLLRPGLEADATYGMTFSPDRRFFLPMDGQMGIGLYRTSDVLRLVGERGIEPAIHDEEDDALEGPDAAPAAEPTLLGEGTMARLRQTSSVSRAVVLDGVTFTLRRPIALRAAAPRDTPFSVALRSDGRFWMAHDRGLYRLGSPTRRAARFDAPVIDLAFAPGGDLLAVLTAGHVHLIEVGAAPRVRAHLALEGLATLFDGETTGCAVSWTEEEASDA